MPQKTLKTERELQDLVRGCTFLGTGGGGSPDEGFAALKTAFEAKGSIKWVDVKNVADDAWTACPYGMGSIAPRTPQVLRMMRVLGLTRVRVQRKLVQVIKELEAYKGIKIEALVPVEIGGFNTPDPLAAGTTLNIPVVDGDYSGGRSIPEIVQTTPYIYEKNMLPIASVDEWGNVCIIKNAVNYFMGEKIGKLIASAAYGLAGNCAFLMKGKEMKQIATTNTLTEALHIGVAIRQAREKGKSPVEAAVKATGGWLLFKGIVSSKKWEDREGYYWGTHEMKGTDEFKGRKLKIWFKNENHVTWLGGKPYITSPDLIVALDMKTGEPKTNPKLKVGDRVAVLGKKARQIFRGKRGLEVLGPKHFGFNVKYTPIEERMKAKR